MSVFPCVHSDLACLCIFLFLYIYVYACVHVHVCVHAFWYVRSLYRLIGVEKVTGVGEIPLELFWLVIFLGFD